MGQQQLLLLVLAVIIVGIAIVVGITMFRAQSASSNLDAVTNDLMDLASRAQQFYIRPVSMGGGGGVFNAAGNTISIDNLTTSPINDNGTYALGTINVSDVEITGEGKQDGDNDGTLCHATVTVDMAPGAANPILLVVDNR
jgi:uncharacterized protein (UPF0333 family)